MNSFDFTLVDSHRRDLHHDAQAAARARRVRSARRWNRKAANATRRAHQADALIS